jgi:hypothetical protein
MGKMRRREPEPETAAVEVDESPVTAEEKVEARAVLDAPAQVVQAGPDAILEWATVHAPEAVRSDEQAVGERNHRERHRAYSRARMEARRAGRPMPRPEDFFGDETHVSAD